MFINFYYIKSIHSEEEYVGSSEYEKEIRLGNHEKSNRCYKRGTGNKCGSFKLLDLGGYTIHLIGTTFCHTNEIRKRHEQYCMDIHPKKLTNIYRAYTSPEMAREMNLVSTRRWELDNHEYLTTDIECECGSHYQIKSKSAHFKTDGCRDYHGLERMPKKKSKTNTCICGAVIVGPLSNLNRHMKSPKHKKVMALNECM